MKLIKVLKERKWSAISGFVFGLIFSFNYGNLSIVILAVALTGLIFVSISLVISKSKLIFKKDAGWKRVLKLGFNTIIVILLLFLLILPGGRLVLPAVTPARNIFTGECRDYPNRSLPWYYQRDEVCGCLSSGAGSCEELPKSKRFDVRW